MKRTLYLKKSLGFALILAMMAGLMPAENAMAAKKVAISKKAITLTVGKKTTLKLKNIKKNKVKWTSSKKSVATVNQSGKVTAKKKGTAKITAKYAGKKYTCKVTVKAKTAKKTKPANKHNSEPNEVSTENPNAAPTKSPNESPAEKPSGKLNKTSLSMDLTQTYQLSLSGATAKKWTSSDKEIAVVADGLVMPKKKGVVTITCEDTRGFAYSCKINIVYPDIKIKLNKIYTQTIGKKKFYSMDFLVANNCDYDIRFGGKEPWTDMGATLTFYYKYGYDTLTAAFTLMENSLLDVLVDANPTITCKKNAVSTFYAFQGETRYIPTVSSEFMWAITINGIKYSVLTDYYGDIIGMVSWGSSDI